MNASSNVLNHDRSISSHLNLPKAILYGTLVAGVLDATDGVIFFGLQGMNPIQVLQYIASGLLGAAAFTGGLPAAGLGVLVHFSIAFVVASIYVLASRKAAVLRTQWFVAGLVYGALVYLIMNFVVLPMTAVAHTPVSTAAFLNGVLGHALFVGLPIAFFARKVPS